MCFLVCRILGTPNNDVWPGVEELPDFKPNFPRWNGKQLSQVIPKLGNSGCDLAKVHDSAISDKLQLNGSA